MPNIGAYPYPIVPNGFTSPNQTPLNVYVLPGEGQLPTDIGGKPTGGYLYKGKLTFYIGFEKSEVVAAIAESPVCIVRFGERLLPYNGKPSLTEAYAEPEGALVGCLFVNAEHGAVGEHIGVVGLSPYAVVPIGGVEVITRQVDVDIDIFGIQKFF